VVKKYPHKPKTTILTDLVAHTPGEEGKWFAAAKSAGLFEDAIVLANRSPCDPKTLNRAARDFVDKNPNFAIEAGITSLRWLVDGYGYDITSADVLAAYTHTMNAAPMAGGAAACFGFSACYASYGWTVGGTTGTAGTLASAGVS